MSFGLVALRSGSSLNSPAVHHSPKEKPTLVAITALHRQVFEALSDFQRKDIIIAQKITFLKQLQGSTTLLRQTCEELQTDCEKMVDEFPFYCFLPKWRLWLAKHDLCILGIDDASATYSTVRKIVIELKKRIQQLVQKELLYLSKQVAKSCEESFDVVGLYDALHLLEPENSKPIECMAKWLIQEKAYAEAAKILQELIKKYPQNLALHFQFIEALLGNKHYQEAEREISEIKLKLTSPPEKEVSREHALQNQADLDKLDELKAECLALQEKYKEALDILKELNKKQPQNDLIKQKIILCMQLKELEDQGDQELSELQKKFFLARPKQIFATLSIFRDTANSHDNLISDLEFWLDTLIAHPRFFENEKINSFIQNQIADLIESGHISKELLVKKVTERLNKQHENQKFLEERFYSLMQNFNQLKDLAPRQLAILKARTAELEHSLYGDSSIHGSIGFLGKRTLAQSLLSKLSKNANYADEESRRCLSLLVGRLNSSETSIVNCRKQFRLLTHKA